MVEAEGDKQKTCSEEMEEFTIPPQLQPEANSTKLPPSDDKNDEIDPSTIPLPEIDGLSTEQVETAIAQTVDHIGLITTAIEQAKSTLPAVALLPLKKRLEQDEATDAYRAMVCEFLCFICSNVVQRMTCCSKCEAIMCQECIDEWQRKSGQKHCPLCQQEFENRQMLRKMTSMLDNLEFNCRFGCGAVFKSEFAIKHYTQECTASLVQQCPMGCDDFRPSRIEKLDEHLMHDCKSEGIKCRHCQLNIYSLYKDRVYLQ